VLFLKWLAAARQIVFSWEQAAPLKSGVSIPEMNIKKGELHTGYQINQRSGTTGKTIFTAIVRTFLKNRSF
jgi:hypothetical protein